MRLLEAQRQREKLFKEEISCRKAETVYRKDEVTRNWREYEEKLNRVSYVDLLVLLRAHKEPTSNGLVNHATLS